MCWQKPRDQILIMRMVLVSMIVIAAMLSAEGAQKVEIRGQVATGNDTQWDYKNFAGFYYDLRDDNGRDNNGKETLILDENPHKKKHYNVSYLTIAKPKKFKFESWGSYNLIGFMGQKYFAGYVSSNDGHNESINDFQFKEANLLATGQLQEILIDDDSEQTISSNSSLKLMERYRIFIKSVDRNGNKIYVELYKDQDLLDSNVVSPATTIASETYCFKRNVGDQKDLAIIAVHFQNAFRGSNQTLVTIDGLWQISDKVQQVQVEDKIETTNSSSSIAMELKNPILLSRDMDIPLMGNIRLRTADNDTLRYCIYSERSMPGSYEIRSTLASTIDSYQHIWASQNFSGFYYDIDENLGTERMSIDIRDGRIRGQKPYGLAYATCAKNKSFEFKDWGQFKVMGFGGQECFAAYIENHSSNNDIFFEASEDPSVFPDEQLCRVLNDSQDEIILSKGHNLSLNEGYSLGLKDIDKNGKLYLELTKDGSWVDSKTICTSADNVSPAGCAYIYRKDVGATKGLAIIGVHFKNSFYGNDLKIAIANGIWQISEQPEPIRLRMKIDKMTITHIDDLNMSLVMENEDEEINLRKEARNEVRDRSGDLADNVTLMKGIQLRYYAYDINDSNKLRYYLFTSKDISGVLAIHTVPENASVYMDGVLKGLTPLALNISTQNDDIELKKIGYKTKNISINKTKSQQAINETLEKNPCQLTLITHPLNASVQIDGMPVTSQEINISQDMPHRIVIVKSGYETFNDTRIFSTPSEIMEIKLSNVKRLPLNNLHAISIILIIISAAYFTTMIRHKAKPSGKDDSKKE